METCSNIEEQLHYYELFGNIKYRKLLRELYIYIYINYSKRFQASKVFHRFNATGLFRIVNG